jgi:hypothetical protein
MKMAQMSNQLPLHKIWQLALEEMARGEAKHPNWPLDQLYAVSIVAEEAGELTRAANQHAMEGGPIMAIQEEAIQTMATCIRLLKNLQV